MAATPVSIAYKAQQLDPGPHFVKAAPDPGDTIKVNDTETLTYTCQDGSEGPDDPLFPPAG
jgi:hypothetical protein